MIKIVFSDFDNTMLDYYSKDNYFDEYKIGVLKRLKEQGIKFCIVSGRSVPFFKQFPNLLEVVDYIMGSNGACIYDVRNDRFIRQSIVEEEVFNKIIDYTVNNNGGFLLNDKDKRIKYGEWQVTECIEYSSELDIKCEQIILSFDVKRLEEVLYYLEQFKSISVNNIDYFKEFCVIDVNNKDVSKGEAAEWLCSYLGIDSDDAIAFGDGENDKSLFKVVNKGIAVGNAVDMLKVLSKDVALDCASNGIYKYIEDNILK